MLSLQLPAGTLIVFDPVTHATRFLDIMGEATKERQALSVVFNKTSVPVDALSLRPGPFHLTLENRTESRVLPAIWMANEALDRLLRRRKPVSQRSSFSPIKPSAPSTGRTRSPSASASRS